MEPMTFKQETYIRKSLQSVTRREFIQKYCSEINVPWHELSKNDAIDLIDKLGHVSW